MPDPDDVTDEPSIPSPSVDSVGEEEDEELLHDSLEGIDEEDEDAIDDDEHGLNIAADSGVGSSSERSSTVRIFFCQLDLFLSFINYTNHTRLKPFAQVKRS